MRHNVIIISYNRPRMLKEAINSVLMSNVDVVCWIYDDGSDFDVVSLVDGINDDRIVLAVAPRMSPEERVRPGNTRWSTNMNWLLDRIPVGETITYLCDDDILNRNWLGVVEDFFKENTETHLIVGDMYYFYDGEDPVRDGRWGFPVRYENDNGGYVIWWNLGSFTHRSECFHKCGVRWRRGYRDNPHSWDIAYINSLLATHVGYIKVNVPAMYRREHDNTLSARAGRIVDGFYVKPADELLPEHVKGMME